MPGVRPGASNDIAVHRHAPYASSAEAVIGDCRFASPSDRVTGACSDAAGLRPFRHSAPRPPATTVPRWECSSVVSVWRAIDDRSGEQRVLLDPGYERSRRVVVPDPGHEPAVDADVERRPLRWGIQLERHCADDRQRKPGRSVPDRGGASPSLSFEGRHRTGAAQIRSDLAASSEPPLQPAARRCTPG